MSRKTIQKNIAYDDTRRLYYVSLYKDGKRKTKTFSSYSQALESLHWNERLPLPNCTLQQWLTWWLYTEVMPYRAESTTYGYRNIIDLHLIPAIGQIPLNALSPLLIQTYLSQKLGENLSPNTVRKHDVLLRTSLRRATDLHLLDHNPMLSVIPPQMRETTYTCYTPQQMRILFHAAHGTMMELPIKLAAYLGLRRSEIAGLRWKCVDLDSQVIVIQEIRTEVGGREVVKLPKTKTSIRKLSFSGCPDLFALLWSLQNAQKEISPEDYVLLQQNGKAPSPNYLTEALLELVRKHHLPPITLHGLRHSFASIANSEGASLHDISHALGHSSITVTSKIYVHLFDHTESHTFHIVANAISSADSSATMKKTLLPT